MKNSSIFFLTVLASVFSCRQDSEPLDSLSDRTGKALIEIDNYYRSTKAWTATQSEIEFEVSQISHKYRVQVKAVEYELYRDYFAPVSKNGRVTPYCSGQILNVEVVFEGNGCFGIVRKYWNGSASITAYCDRGATFNGYYCYE